MLSRRQGCVNCTPSRSWSKSAVSGPGSSRDPLAFTRGHHRFTKSRWFCTRSVDERRFGCLDRLGATQTVASGREEVGEARGQRIWRSRGAGAGRHSAACRSRLPPRLSLLLREPGPQPAKFPASHPAPRSPAAPLAASCLAFKYAFLQKLQLS